MLFQSLHVSSQGPRVPPGRRSHGDRSCVLCLRYCFCGKKPQSRPLIPVYYSSLNPKIGASGTPVELAIAFLTEMRGLPVKRATHVARTLISVGPIINDTADCRGIAAALAALIP